jgi:hypothetical protein
MTMKSKLRATIMVFSIGSSAAHAGDSYGYSATTPFASMPAEQSSQVATAPRQAAIAIPNGAVARGYGYVTTGRRGTWLFAPDSGEH